MENKLEYWQSGPIEGVPALLQPVAHTLLQAKREVREYATGFPTKLLWEKPSGLASVGFHLQHLTGVLDRLFTYARGEQLSETQLSFLRIEGVPNPDIDLETLLTNFENQVLKAIEEIKTIKDSDLISARGVGRKQIPSTVIGLLFHAAEHSMRHVGQLLVTIKVVVDNKEAGN